MRTLLGAVLVMVVAGCGEGEGDVGSSAGQGALRYQCIQFESCGDCVISSPALLQRTVPAGTEWVYDPLPPGQYEVDTDRANCGALHFQFDIAQVCVDKETVLFVPGPDMDCPSS